MARFWILKTLPLVLAACTTHGMNGSGAMDGQLAEAEEELDRHHGVVMRAASLPEVIEEAGRHDSNMGRVMDRMAGAMAGMMSHCSGSEMDRMHEMMTGMQAEMHDHGGALENAAELGFARSACESHVTEMREMLSNIDDALGDAGCGMMAW